MNLPHRFATIVLTWIAAVAVSSGEPTHGDDTAGTHGVRMGNGSMTFETVPKWGMRPDGTSPLGSTHGAIVIDQAGNIFTSSSRGVFVYTPEGQVIQSYLYPEFTNFHDMEIRMEDGVEYIYAANNSKAMGIKFDAHSGEIVLRLPYPAESNLGDIAFKPTAITVASDGRIYLSNGYASNHIFVYDQQGNYLSHFGEKGNDLRQFNTAHGMTIDRRYEPARLLICDRNHQPRGRLLHYDLDGQFIAEVITGLGMPTSVAIDGDHVSVPDLEGRLVILDGRNMIVAVLGHNPDLKTGSQFKVPQSRWIEGVFSGTHGSFWDRHGNLYVQDWNMDGRIMKLKRIRLETPPQ